MQDFFLQSKLYVSLEISLELVEICKLGGFGLDFCVKRKMIGLWSVNRTVGCFDPSIRNSYSVSVYIMAVHSLIRVESRSSA